MTAFVKSVRRPFTDDKLRMHRGESPLSEPSIQLCFDCLRRLLHFCDFGRRHDKDWVVRRHRMCCEDSLDRLFHTIRHKQLKVSDHTVRGVKLRIKFSGGAKFIATRRFRYSTGQVPGKIPSAVNQSLLNLESSCLRNAIGTLVEKFEIRGCSRLRSPSFTQSVDVIVEILTTICVVVAVSDIQTSQICKG
jgi:hypothetical protein